VNVVSQNYILYHQPKPSEPKKKAEQVCWIPSTFHPGWRLVRTFFTNSERDMGYGPGWEMLEPSRPCSTCWKGIFV